MKRKKTKERKKKIKYFKKTFSKKCILQDEYLRYVRINFNSSYTKAIDDKIMIGDFYFNEMLKNDPEIEDLYETIKNDLEES